MDTDATAMMAGAILGLPPKLNRRSAFWTRRCPGRKQLAKIARQPEDRTPDLLHWTAPATLSDALAKSEHGALWVLGLRRVVARDDPVSPEAGEFQWRWAELEAAGQILLIERRKVLARQEETLGLLDVLECARKNRDDDRIVGAAFRRSSTRACKEKSRRSPQR